MKILLGFVFLGFCGLVPLVLSESLAVASLDPSEPLPQSEASPQTTATTTSSNEFLTRVFVSVQSFLDKNSETPVQEETREKNTGIVRF